MMRPAASPHRADRGQIVGTALLIACALTLAGCAGYQVGTSSLYAPHIRTVYVPIFESASYRRHLGEQLTEAVIKEIEAKTTYKVVSTPEADSVLLGRIVSDTKRTAASNRFSDPRQIDLSLTVEVRWLDRQGLPIHELDSLPMPDQSVRLTGEGQVYPEVGQSIATGQLDAMQRIAQQIVGMMEQPW